MAELSILTTTRTAVAMTTDTDMTTDTPLATTRRRTGSYFA
jgi:hypothetical protein